MPHRWRYYTAPHQTRRFGHHSRVIYLRYRDLRARIRFRLWPRDVYVLVVWPGIVPDNHPLAGQVRLIGYRGTMGAPTPGREADRPVAFLRMVPTLEDRPGP